MVWSDISTHILEETKRREEVNWEVDDINLFLASQIVNWRKEEKDFLFFLSTTTTLLKIALAIAHLPLSIQYEIHLKNLAHWTKQSKYIF